MQRTITRQAPAKINLGLDITGKRPDGYHLLKTVFQTISIWDTITVTRTETPEIALACETPSVPCNEKNLAWKAAHAFRSAAGISDGVHIHLIKRIPMEAGMGGGSTDAAAVLLAMQELTDSPLSMERLCGIAAGLGADVPFFLYGGTAYAEGIGEMLKPLPAFQGAHLVIAKGSAGVSTAEAYRAIDALQNPAHPPVDALRDALTTGASPAKVAALCGNLFETAISLPEVDAIRQCMRSNGALTAVMTGSGAAVFGIFDTAADADQAATALRQIVPFVCCCEAC